MKTPGFLGQLQSHLESLSFEDLERVNSPGGLEIRDILDFILKPRDHTVHMPYEISSESITTPSHEEDFYDKGKTSLATGKIALCFIVNDFSTDSKATEKTTIEHILTSTANVSCVWVMTPNSSLSLFKERLKEFKHVVVFPQFESFCLTPDNRLHTEGGRPVFHSCGSGDAINALKRSQILDKFLSGGGEHIVFIDIDNYKGIPSPSTIQEHVLSESPVTCLITKRIHGDSAPIVCEHAGFGQIVERFRFSSHTDIEQFKYMSTGAFIVDARLDFDNVKWTWHRRKKIVGTQIVVQYQRYLQDLTSAFKTRFTLQDRDDLI